MRTRARVTTSSPRSCETAWCRRTEGRACCLGFARHLTIFSCGRLRRPRAGGLGDRRRGVRLGGVGPRAGRDRLEDSLAPVGRCGVSASSSSTSWVAPSPRSERSPVTGRRLTPSTGRAISDTSSGTSSSRGPRGRRCRRRCRPMFQGMKVWEGSGEREGRADAVVADLQVGMGMGMFAARTAGRGARCS